MAAPKQFDLKEIETLNNKLEEARLEYHKTRLDAEKSHHRLLREADSTIGKSVIQRQRAVKTHEKRKQHYERVFAIHKQRIRGLLEEIERQVACAKWEDWTLSEFLVRWLSGNLDFEIFKAVEPGMKLVEAFEKLEYDLLPPSLGVVLHVSAQVAAGWYSKPTGSPFWVPRPSRSSFDDSDYTPSRPSVETEDIDDEYRETRDGFEVTGDGNYTRVQAYSYGEKGNAEMFDASESGEGCESDESYIVEEYGAKQRKKTLTEKDSYTEEQSGGEDYSFEDKPTRAKRAKPIKMVPLVWGRNTGRTIMATEYIE